MTDLKPESFDSLYAGFHAPISALDCGKKCAPYNEGGAPFCCDTRHAVPTAYTAEWIYLQENTDLWHAWQGPTPSETERLQRQTPGGQVLIECQGHSLCQRSFRSLTCRSFPFFPYLSREGEFLGLSYYWEYEDRCWVISNLGVVTPEYRQSFFLTYERLFSLHPEERTNFRYHSSSMRRSFSRRRRAIPLLHRNGFFYKVSPGSGRQRRVAPHSLPKFGPYAVVSRLPFPDEVEA